MKKQLYGQITLGYADYVLPLEQAHKLQALLAEHAVTIDATYTPRFDRVFYVKDLQLGVVGVVEYPPFDTRGMSDSQKAEWLSAIRAEDAQSIIDPQHFKTLSE